MRTLLTFFLLTLVACPRGTAQVNLGGQAAAQLFKSARTAAPREVGGAHAAFGWRGDLFLDGSVTDNTTVLANFRVDETEHLFFDYLAIRLEHLTAADLNIQAGKFDMPYGNLGERRYPRNNSLYSLPLLYEYPTSVQNHPVSESDLLASRGKGSGLRMLDGGIYDVGADIYGALDIFTYAVAFSNNTVSTSSYGQKKTTNDFGKIIRLTATPTTGLTIGGAYAWGTYLYTPLATPAPDNRTSYAQKSAELDLAFSRGHFVFYAEAVYGTWEVPLGSSDQDLGAFGYYAEGKYTLIPRLYVALRFNALVFRDALLGGISQPWDYNVSEWEGGIGYFLDRNVLVKLIRRESRTFGGTRPKDNLTVVQIAVSY
jgi:hypothetical protein